MFTGIIDSNQKIVGPPSLNFNNDISQKRCYSGSGTTVNDLSGNGLNGTLTNSPTFNSGNGGYISFSGANQYLTYGTNAGVSNITYNSDGTFCFWIYPQAYTSFLLGKNDGANALGYGWNIFIDGTGNIGFDDIRDTTNGRYYSTSNVTLNTWQHITVVWVSNTGAYFYKNGTAVGTPGSYLGAGAKRDDSAYSLQFGTYGYTDGTNAYTGRLSQLQIYKRALSSTQVLQNYNASRSRYGL